MNFLAEKLGRVRTLFAISVFHTSVKYPLHEPCTNIIARHGNNTGETAISVRNPPRSLLSDMLVVSFAALQATEEKDRFFEGDIILESETQLVPRGGISRMKRAVKKALSSRWENGIIYYIISKKFSK